MNRVSRLALAILAAVAVLLPEAAHAAWIAAPRLITPRYDHSATLLLDGRILVAGGTGATGLDSAEVFDPATGRWSPTGRLLAPRSGHAGVLLPSGKVLVVGGVTQSTSGPGVGLASAEVYDPATGTWSAAGSLASAVAKPTATLLRSGRVLVVGSAAPGSTSFAAEYNPAGSSWLPVSAPQFARTDHTANLLPNGGVLVSGGGYGIVSREIYDPATQSWTAAADFLVSGSGFPIPRVGLTSTVLADGRVLSAGGVEQPSSTAWTELYDPATNQTTQTGNLTDVAQATATLLPSGRVLVAGGVNLLDSPGDPAYISQVWTFVYDPAPGTWTAMAPLAHQRTQHTATLLPDGRVVVIGGIDPHLGGFGTAHGVPGAPVADVEIFDAAGPGSVSPEQPPFDGSYPDGTLPTLLPSGQVLLPRAGLIYDPATGTRRATGTPLPGGQLATSATLLPDGRVLLVGALAQVYNPATELWSATGPLAQGRFDHTATLLPNGKVLVAGGALNGQPAVASAEVFDPATGTWSPTGAMSVPRAGHTASVLPDGRVLIAGGATTLVIGGGPSFHGSAEIYDFATGTFTLTGGLADPRALHSAAVLRDGRVLVVGGTGDDDVRDGGLATAEIYDPAAARWTSGGSMMERRTSGGAVLLLSGKVLVYGAFPEDSGGGSDRAFPLETYDPTTGVFTPGPEVCRRRTGNATLLADGRVLFSGSEIFPCVDQVYEPDQGLLARRPRITATGGALAFGQTFTLTGTGLRGDSEASSGSSRSSAANVPVMQLRSVATGVVTPVFVDPRTQWGDEPMTLSLSRLPASLSPGFQLVTVFVDGLPSLPAPGGASTLTGLACSIAVTTEPASQTVPLGGSATFSVVAAGARTYQWRRDGVAIPGATGPAYLTPPVLGADSGARYDVVVAGPCASTTSATAVLTVADATPPQATVVTPSGGEYWLLSPAGGPARTEEIAWSMSDDIRICQVEVSLLYSDNGGVNYLPVPAGPSLPRTFGPGGSCSFPGVGTTNLTYAVPTTYPSGRSGSLYRIQVAVRDQVGNTTTALSQNPFYILQSNPDVRTLILSNPARMQTVMGVTPAAAAALDTKLRDLSVHARVQGALVDLGSISALSPLYAAYDAAVAARNGSSIDAANNLLFATSGIHDQLLARLRAFPGVRYVVVVGDDRIVPLARIPDGTSLFDETNYPAGGDLGTTSPVGQALAARRYLSDDALGLVTTVRPADISASLFLPDLSVGRLVETPEEITNTIATFIGQDGVLDLGALDPASGRKVLVTGYDFLSDSAALIGARWKAVYGGSGSPASSPAPVDAALIGGNWGLGSAADRRSALLARLCGNGGARYGIASLSGHANHFLEGVPADGGSFTDIEGLTASSLLAPNACGGGGVDLAGGIVYAVGCHGGLTVPGSNAADVDHSLDLPQTFLSRGVVAYVANTGYGWGPRFGPGYSKRLMEILSELLAVPGSVVTGDAVRLAKLRYFDQTSSPDAYDTKSLMQWTLFGLPMYAVNTGIAAPAASLASVSGPPVDSSRSAKAAPRTGKAGVETFGAARVERKAALAAGATTNASGPPPSLTQLDLRFDFTAAGVYQKRGASGGALGTPGCSDPNGCYYVLNGLATGRTDRPIEPYFVYDSRLSGTSQHGVLWKGGTYDQESGWKPVFTELVSNGGDGSDHGVAPRLIIERPTTPRRVPGADPDSCASSDDEVNSLVVGAGEALTNNPADPPYSTQRRFRDVNVEVLYFNNSADPTENCDRSGPQILGGTLPGGAYHTVDGTLVEWAVPASDAAGVWRVLVVVNDNSVDGTGRGRWTPVELVNDGSGTWRGSYRAADAGVVTYVLEAVDNKGNVSWLDFTAAAPAASSSFATASTSGGVTTAAAGGLPSSGVPLSVPRPIDVAISGPAGPRVDSFSPTSGLVGSSVSIFGRNLGGTSAVRFNGTTAQFAELSATNLMAVVPPGATSGPISVSTALGSGQSATSFTVVSGLAIGDVTVTRPPAGAVTASFVVTLTPASPANVTVHYQTADDSALAGTDYTATAGDLTFLPGQTQKTIPVPVLGNGTSGPARRFFVNLTSPGNAGLLDAQGVGTVLRPFRGADWNADGKADLLWQQQTTGELALWMLDGGRRVGVSSLTPEKSADKNQGVSGVGDLNRDGQPDIVFQHQTQGTVTFWLMNGLKRTTSVTLTPSRPAAFKVAAVADFNGDDGADLVWQNTATGAVDIWFLNGTAFQASAAVTPARPVAWRVVGSGDWNGDGKNDLLWQNASTGEMDVWFMNGAARLGTAALNPSKPTNLTWKLTAVGDFNADGKPDLLFRQLVVGELQIWPMNGTARTATQGLLGVNYPGEVATTPTRVLFDVTWEIVAPR